jgi:hypothetical protein
LRFAAPGCALQLFADRAVECHRPLRWLRTRTTTLTWLAPIQVNPGSPPPPIAKTTLLINHPSPNPPPTLLSPSLYFIYRYRVRRPRLPATPTISSRSFFCVGYDASHSPGTTRSSISDAATTAVARLSGWFGCRRITQSITQSPPRRATASPFASARALYPVLSSR